MYFNVVLQPFVRWAVLLALFLSLAHRKRLVAGLRGQSAFFAYALLLYCVLTTLWSPVPQLSGPKSLTYLMVAICYSSGSAIWIRTVPPKEVLNVLFPLMLMAIIAGIGGLAISNSAIQMNESISLYRGLTQNPNFLGLLIVGALPLPLWIIGNSKSTKRQRRWYYLFLATMFVALLNTISRASILASAIIIVFYLFGRGTRRSILIFSSVVVLVILFSVLLPSQTDSLVQRFVYKGSDVTTSVFASRQEAWKRTYEGAREGGLFGLGYGVSFGDEVYSLGVGSAEYGREKAIVALAIIEEVGLVGLALFVGFVLAVVVSASRAIRGSRERDEKLLLCILLGAIFAMLVHAQFEAWLFSPGGAITPVFWSAIGMTVALSRRAYTPQQVRNYYVGVSRTV